MFAVVLCFFFKQKTAYEMRSSDWSSDVCSSDLGDAVGLAVVQQDAVARPALGDQYRRLGHGQLDMRRLCRGLVFLDGLDRAGSKGQLGFAGEGDLGEDRLFRRRGAGGQQGGEAQGRGAAQNLAPGNGADRKSTRLNSSH